MGRNTIRNASRSELKACLRVSQAAALEAADDALHVLIAAEKWDAVERAVQLVEPLLTPLAAADVATARGKASAPLPSPRLGLQMRRWRVATPQAARG